MKLSILVALLSTSQAVQINEDDKQKLHQKSTKMTMPGMLV
jgi:hypothetical protein